MLYPFLGLTWLAMAIYLFLARESLEAAGIAQAKVLAVVAGAGLLAAYDFFRWGMSRRARRRRQASAEKKKESPPKIVNPELDFSDPPDKKT